MSQFQYYEFHAIDKTLSTEDLEAVRQISSRVRLSTHKAVFTYSYGSFRYKEEEVLLDHFDFMIYKASWGAKRIMLKFPEETVDYELLKKYRISVTDYYQQDIRVLKKSGFVILDLYYTEEDSYSWIDENVGDDWYLFLDLRTEIMNGDCRSLFAVWLRFLEGLYKSTGFDVDYNFESILIPPNLSTLTRTGQELKVFYETKQDWWDAMCLYSKTEVKEAIDYEQRLLEMPKDRMIVYLQMILRDEVNLKIRLTKELKDESKTKKEIRWLSLLEIGGKVADIEHLRREKERQEEARQERRRMEKLKLQQYKMEKEIPIDLELGRKVYYKMAISKMKDLKNMHEFFGTQEEFGLFLNEVLPQHTKKTSLMNMLRDEGLI